MGMRFAGAPGDCVLEGSGWSSTGGGCRDLATGGVVWSRNALDQTGAYRTFQSAGAYCSDLVEGGFGDWRVPTKDELISASGHDAVHHLAGSTIPTHAFWSSTARGGKNYAYVVQFNDGIARLVTQNSWTDVSCVRNP